MQNDLPYRNLDLYASDLAEIQISVGEVIDPSWRGDVAKVTSIEIQISVGEVETSLLICSHSHFSGLDLNS